VEETALMSFYGYRTAAVLGPGFGSFAGYDLDIVGGVRFDEAWSANDWRSQNWGGFYAYNYAPLPSAAIDRAREHWQAMQDHIDAGSPLRAQYLSKMQNYRTNLEGWSSIVDRFTRTKEYAGAYEDPKSSRTLYLDEINKMVSEISNLQIPDPYVAIEEAEQAAERRREAEAAAAKAEAARQQAAADAAKVAQTKAEADAATTAAKLEQTQAAIQSAKYAVAAANQAKAVAAASAQRNKELQAIAVQKSAMTAKRVPLVIGGLAALTAGAIYLARRKKK
jgi:hypothetical protein